MLCRLFPEPLLRSLVAVGMIVLGAAHVAAAPATPAVLPFDGGTWQALTRAPQRPLAVVFSSTDCSHCPKVIDDMAAAIRKSRNKAQPGAQLIVVVMDGARQEAALRTDPHTRNAQRLYVFTDDPQALRYTVNPDWRGLTPYVALIPLQGAPRFYTGAPPAAALAAFLLP